jgi:hypothetical protein
MTLTIPGFLDQATTRLPCRDQPDLFHSKSAADRARAIQICASCPLRVECAAYATAANEPGVWGGFTRASRNALARGEQPAANTSGDDGYDRDDDGLLLCGSEAAHKAHKRRGEPIDDDCAEAHEDHLRAGRRERLEREHARGGTAAGYGLHQRLREPACTRCLAAEAAKSAARRAVKQAARARERLSSVPAGRESTDGPVRVPVAAGVAA